MTSQVVSRRMTKTDDLARRRFELMAAEFVARMGERLRARRDELGLTRAEVARRMPGKVNENQVYRWENGKHQPNPDTLEALAKVLKISVAALMAPEPDKSETPDPLASPGNGNEAGTVEERLTAIEEMLRLIRAEMAASVAEVMSRIDEALPPIQEAPRRRRA